MYPAPIESYERPATIAGALEAMANAGEGAVYLAGGTGLMPSLRARALRPRTIVDLADVEELGGISKGPRGITIRPTTRLSDLARTFALRGAAQAITDVAATLGDRQVRNAATIGGGLYWNGGASCVATAALCLDAVLVLRSAGGEERLLPAAEFLERRAGGGDDGRDLLVEIRLPAAGLSAASAYKKAAPSPGGLPLAGVAALVEVDGEGQCSGARLAVAGLTASARLFEGAGALLTGFPIDDARATAAAAAAVDALAPASGCDTAHRYRKDLVRSLARTVIARARLRARDKAFGDPPP